MKTKLLLSACILAALNGCRTAPTAQQELSCVLNVPSHFSTVLTTPNKGWSECFHHTQGGLLDSVADRINEIASQPDGSFTELDDLLYYLRAHAYYTDLKHLTSKQWDKINTALHAVATSPNFAQNNESHYRILEHLYVAIYQYSSHKNNAVAVEFATAMLARSVHLQSLTEDSQAYQYQLLELYRSIGFLSYQARRQTELKTALTNSPLAEELLRHLTLLDKHDWRLENTLWALASLHYLLPPEQQAAIDKHVTTHIFSQLSIEQEHKRKLFSQIFLANSYRYSEQCDKDFKGQCSIPNIDDVLPLKHECSDTLYIRAAELSKAQLDMTCNKLTSQESFFHSTLATNQIPVKDDFNSKLRVVIFNNYSDYNRWGQLVFNIATDNGGMYIEGKPEEKDNQATFYSFQAFWQQPSFSVWNLNHEYVHYLDGRYVKYGAYGHYPSHTVWWSEGLAEYISVQQQNKQAFALLNKVEQADWPTLEQIFATEYNNGLDRVYRWSYLAIRFIFESSPKQGQQLANALKNNDFESYKGLLDNLATKAQPEFYNWLSTHKPKFAIDTPVRDKLHKYQSTPLYRYLYRSYLRPQHLPIDAKHFHFSNWG